VRRKLAEEQFPRSLANIAVREAIDKLVPLSAPRPTRPAPLAGGGPIANRKKIRR
jgi:hypothetical protein